MSLTGGPRFVTVRLTAAQARTAYVALDVMLDQLTDDPELQAQLGITPAELRRAVARFERTLLAAGDRARRTLGPDPRA